MTEIALFGTSADPPTAGHQAILKWLSEHFDRVAVWASDNPFKSHQTGLEHRAMMLDLLIRDIYPPRENIYLRQDFSDRRSLFSVEKAKRVWGDRSNYTLVIGSDLVGQIRRWYRVGDLLEQVKILVIPRPGYPIDPEDLRQLEALGARCSIADLNAPPVSSTDYREKGDNEAVTPPVRDYIYREKLYA
ncbi:nicotinate-nucleotide adenylyltransferase [Pannus brasiliensis CCIBt3594]|uniref:nicotinate-nucleotide adenylyltransferase n=1 Tax=Pannus brasiliensis CCIBt3594 TaxID=1427578 RepID=A0AAW9QW12_9CHRO